MKKTISLELNDHQLSVLWVALRNKYDRSSDDIDHPNEMIREIAKRQAHNALEVLGTIEKAIDDLHNY